MSSLHVPTTQATPASHDTGVPASQTPLVQISSPLQKLPSLQSSLLLHCVGKELGAIDGLPEAVTEGPADGEASGLAVGALVGILEGLFEGEASGLAVGVLEGAVEGVIEGDTSGLAVGAPVGDLLGIKECRRVGDAERKRTKLILEYSKEYAIFSR